MKILRTNWIAASTAALILLLGGCSDDDGAKTGDAGGTDTLTTQSDGGADGALTDAGPTADQATTYLDSGPDTICDPECIAFYDFYCIKVPAGTGPCKECTSDIHCQGNPRALGPTCNVEDKFCICETNADCVGRTTGSVCKPLGNYTACGCDSADDCTEPYTLCYGSLIMKCEKPCQTSADCPDKGGFPGTCNTTTGECQYE